MLKIGDYVRVRSIIEYPNNYKKPKLSNPLLRELLSYGIGKIITIDDENVYPYAVKFKNSKITTFCIYELEPMNDIKIF